MAEFLLLAAVAVVLVSGVLIFNIVKGIVQTILLTLAVTAILVAVAGGFVVMDALELKDGFVTGENALLFHSEDGRRITAGIILNANQPGIVPASGIEVLNQQFAARDLEGMRAGSYKLLLVNETLLTGQMPGIAGDGALTADQAQAINLVLASGDAETRALALAGLFMLKAKESPEWLVSAFKSGRIAGYPETAMFKAIKIFPIQIFRAMAKKAFGGPINAIQAG